MARSRVSGQVSRISLSDPDSNLGFVVWLGKLAFKERDRGFVTPSDVDGGFILEVGMQLTIRMFCLVGLGVFAPLEPSFSYICCF